MVFFFNWRFSEPSVTRSNHQNGNKLGTGTNDAMGKKIPRKMFVQNTTDREKCGAVLAYAAEISIKHG